MPLIDWHDYQIEAAVLSAFTDAMLLLGREFTREFTDEKWDWPDGEARDIVDDGFLRASQLMTQIDKGVFEWSWNMRYALAVHNGATFKNGTELPARPWTELPLKKLPTIFSRLASAKLGVVK